MRTRRPPKMGRAKLMRWTKRIMEAPSLDEAVQVLRRMAHHVPVPGPTEGKVHRPGLSWRNIIQMLARRLRAGKGYSPFISKEGNVKLPFWSFSTLPLFTCPGAGECAEWCYSLTAWRHAAPWARQVQNTLLLRFRKGHIAQSLHKLPYGGILRLYVDGDFDSVATVDFWMQLLRKRPDIRAYGYSKSWEEIWNWWHDVGKHWGTLPNYRLNLSTGGRPQSVTREEMLTLPFVRGDFLSLDVVYQSPHRGNIGFKRYEDPQYHKAVREAGSRIGLKVFSCPGKCGDCCGGQHACGSDKFRGVTIALGIH